MKLSERWLREWVNPPLSITDLTAQLTLAGLELDSITPVAAPFSHVVIGEIVHVTAHPSANHLQICQVNVGTVTPLNIVCGAPNVRTGLLIPTALIGAQLPNEVTIQKTSLRGVLSEGMLCSPKELGLGEFADGLLILPGDAPIGEDVRRYLELEDVSIDIDLTPNRGDCLSVAGIAREAGVLTRCPLTPPIYPPVVETIPDTFPIDIQATQACPRYVGRVIKQVNAQAPTPLWMQERLRRSGQRCINAIVDATNYVLLELGQPLHAFDFDCLTGGIQVRLARKNESLTLLDEQTVSLDEHTLIIADQQKPLAIAGVMGGLESAVTVNTQTLFLESAFFAPQTLAGCARRYGLQTDAAHRFERGVDFNIQRQAIERVTALLLDSVGGVAGPVMEVFDTATLPTLPTIHLRQSRIQRLLGHDIAREEVSDILIRLGMTLTETAGGWYVQPPSARVFDITQEADLIEEIARIHGYQQLPPRRLNARLTIQPQPAGTVEQVQAVLKQRSYQEAITYSFVNNELQTKLNPAVQAVRLANPLASDMTVMRTTLWSSLLPALQYNQKRQQARVRLFEVGLRFTVDSDCLQQEKMLAGIVAGTRYPEQWAEPIQPLDFFDIKADVEALLHLTSNEISYHFKPTTHPALHPGQTAALYQEAEQVGLLGAIHPRWLKTLDLTPPVYLFELRLTPLLNSRTVRFREVSKFPSIRRDIAVVVDENTALAAVLASIERVAGELLIEIRLFDVYQGQGIEVGKKSLAIGLIFQAISRNLLESEIDTVVTHIVVQLEHTLNAQLRK
jgi:phenylalanyl-tRNA synthetase beta chain